jgi:hypothetical protein
MKKIKVYVAGPYTKGDVAVNVRNAFAAAEELAGHGFYPFVPHYSHFWHMFFPHPYPFWMDMDREWLLVCDAVLRIPGESSGADDEVDLARVRRIPVFTELEALVEHFNRPRVAPMEVCYTCGHPMAPVPSADPRVAPMLQCVNPQCEATYE